MTKGRGGFVIYRGNFDESELLQCRRLVIFLFSMKETISSHLFP